MDQLDFHWTHFYEIWYLNVVRKAAEKIQELLKSDKYNRYLHEDIRTFMMRSQFLEREIFQTKVVEKTKTLILCAITLLFFFSFENCAIYKICGKI
jgi:hypothetical protein